MGYWQFKSGVEKPAEQWRRAGKVEWHDSIVIQFQPREILRYLRQFANVLEAGTEDTYEMSIAGQLSPRYDDDEAGWIPLGVLPAGALFEAKTGDRGVKRAEPATDPDRVRVVFLDGRDAQPLANVLVRRLSLP